MTGSPFLPLYIKEDSPDAWKRQGECFRRSHGHLVHDPELFFPIARNEEAQRPGKRICVDCPVIRECRAWALARDEHGIWGGLSEYERRHIQRGLLPPDFGIPHRHAG